MNEEAQITPETLVRDCVDGLHAELTARWEGWKIDLDQLAVHDAVGSLLARQVTLATELGDNPGIWNPHVAPVLLRVMTDAYITLAWIFDARADRAREYIEYGLGQEKLDIEHLKSVLHTEEGDSRLEQAIEAREVWLSSQKFPWLTEVNVGNMGNTNTRRMAESADCLDLYRFAYQPFSAAVHNTWPHVGKYNVRPCENSLHRPHRVPFCPEYRPDIDYFFRAVRYVEKSFRLFDGKTGIKTDVQSALASFEQGMDELVAAALEGEGE